MMSLRVHGFSHLIHHVGYHVLSKLEMYSDVSTATVPNKIGCPFYASQLRLRLLRQIYPLTNIN